MGKPYSEDLRLRVLSDSKAGESPTHLARRYRISRSTVYRLLELYRETGSVSPRQGNVGRRSSLAGAEAQLQRLVERCPDATLIELRDQLPVATSTTAVWRALRKLGITLKKSHSRRRTTAA